MKRKARVSHMGMYAPLSIPSKTRFDLEGDPDGREV